MQIILHLLLLYRMLHFSVSTKEILKSQGITDGLLLKMLALMNIFLPRSAPEDSGVDTYGVSRTAAYVKLRKFSGFVVDQETVNKEKKQVRLFKIKNIFLPTNYAVRLNKSKTNIR